MSRGPPHRFNPTGERSFRGYPPIARYGEFSCSSSYGYYSGPPYKRQRRLSEDDVGPSGGSYGPAYYDPPYVRHQEVGLGDFNDFSSISGKDIKIERDGTKIDHERPEFQPKKRQTSTEGSGYSLQNHPDSPPSSPHSKASPRFSPRRPTTPPFSVASQPLLITTSQVQSSKAPSMTSPNEASSFSKQHSIHLASSGSSQSMTLSGINMQEKLKDSTGRPAPISLLPSGGGQRKDSYPGPAIEAISPSAPASEANGGEKKTGGDDVSDLMSKDELLQSMEKVDREITQVEQQINNLKKKQKQLEEEASKQPTEAPEEEAPLPEPKPKSVVQMIYEENKKKAETAAARLAKLSVPLPGGKPLYNQPSDLPCYHENLRRGPAVKAKLVKYFQLRKQAKELKNRQLCKEYKTLKQAWLKKIERNENNPKRKQKEAKLREFYEKVFPEIKKQREQTERFTRMGSRSNWGIVARSEAEFNEIVDNLNEQEANERHMRTLAVEPPPMLDREERRVKFINRNGLIRDPLATLNERKHKNIWTEKERRIFKDKFIQNPKDFDLIASFLPGKSVSDCILFYYQTKKKEHYKQLSRRHNLKKRRRDQSQFGSSRECTPTNKARASASESSAKGERGGSDGEEDLEEITDSAEESDENNEHVPPPVTTAQVTTPTPSVRHTGRPDHVETSRWSEKEIEIALQGLRDCGRDWEAIAQRVVTKTGAQCKNFYFNYKKKLHLEALVAEHEATKMQRAQQQQQQRQPQQQQQQHRHQQQQQQQQQQLQLQPQPQQHPQEHQRDNPNLTQKRESAPKKNIRPQTSDSYSSLSSNPHNKPSSASTDNVATTSGRESTSVIVGTISTSVGPPRDAAPTATSPSSILSLPLVAPRIVSSHSPHLPLTSSSSTLFMPTPGVIASIGRASPNVGTGQPGQVYFRPSLPESTKHDTPHSRSPHPEAIFSGLVYPRAVDPRVVQSDPSHLRPSFLVSSRSGHPHSDVHPLYHGSAVPMSLGYSVDPPHSSALHPSSSSSSLPNKGDLQAGSSHPITSHPGISHTGKSHVGDSYGHSSEPSHGPTSSILFASSGSPVSVISNRVPARPTSNSPVPVVPQTSTDQREKPHSQVPIISERSTGHPIKPPYPNTYPVYIRGEPASKSSLSDDGRRDISAEVRGVSERSSYAGDTRKPDVIIIDADDRKKRVEGLHGLETSEGKQASSMLRMLASGGSVPTSSAEHIPQVTEPVRPQSLPLSSVNRVISHTELRSQQSATPPCSLASRQQTLNPPPPLIQMSSSRDKKYVMAHELALVPSRSHTEAHHDRHPHVSQETTVGRDKSRHTHTPVDNRGGEREKRASVVETVDLTRDREVSTSSLARPTARSPGIALGSSSARATLQAMARYALAETSNTDVTENIEQKKKDDAYLPPRQPDPKLSDYEQNEAIRKFTALGNVCVSAPREFPGGGEYPSQPYALMAMQAHHQPHIHPHPASSSTPPPYGYPFHVGHPMASFHHHPEHRLLVPVGVHQLPVREMLPQSVNGEDLPSHLKLSGAYTHQYPQGAAYYPLPSMSPIVPTYQQMTVCGHRYPVALSEERRAVHHTHDVPVRRQNEISEQELANPFVVKPPRHMHAPGMPERVVSPGDLPKFPLPSRSPKEPAKRPHTISPEMKPQIAAQIEEGKTVSPPVGNYLSRKPSRPTSVSEMRNRAAVIPDLTGAEGVGQKFPDPQPVVLVPSSKLSGSGKPFKSADDNFIRGDKTGQGTKEQATEEKAGPLAEALPMSAFATLVDVAAAARKVDVPIGVHTPQTGTTELEETYDSPTARLGGHTIVSPPTGASPPSPSRTSPGVSSTPRYGITTGLVPKPPPLMPITGMRPLQEGSSSSSTPISISTSGHGNVPASRSPSKLTSPTGTRSTRASVSPDGPPPLISRPAISPTSTGSPQGTSPKGPPPLIKGIVPAVLPALRSPEREADNTRKTRSKLEDIPFFRRPDHDDSVSRGPFQTGMQSVDVDFHPKFGMHFAEPGPASSETGDDGITKNRSLSPHAAGQAQVRTIFETITYVDSGLGEGRHPSRHQLNPYQAPSTGVHQSEEFPTLARSSSPMCAEEKDRRVSEMTRTRIPETEQYKNVPSHLQPKRSSKDPKPNADQREKQIWQVNQTAFSFQQESQAGYRNENLSLPQNEPLARAEISRASGSETEEGDEGDEETEDEVPPVYSSSATLHPRIRALTRSSQSNVQSPYYDPSDSETLSAEESEVPPESSDELFPSTTVKSGTQSDSSSDHGKEHENERIASDCNDTADTGPASADDMNVQGSSRDYSDDEDEQAQKCVLDEVTSTGPLSIQVFDVSTEQPTVDSPTTSTFVNETEEILERPDADAKGEREMETSDGQDTREEMGAVADQEWNSSESSPGKLAMDDSSEALPAQESLTLQEEDALRVYSSEDGLVGSSETDKATIVLRADSSDQQSLQITPDSSANLENRPDGSLTSPPLESIDNYGPNVQGDVTSIVEGDGTTTAQSATEVQGDVLPDITDEQSTWTLEKEEDVYECPSTSVIEREGEVSSMLDQADEEDEEINEADALQKPAAQHEFLIEPDTYSSSSENHHPEISSAVDCVSDDGEQVPYATFVGEFFPLPGGVDSPDVKSGCSTHIPSEENSVCDDMPPERETKDVSHLTSPKQDVLRQDEGVHHPEDALSVGEIPPSQDSSQSEDEHLSLGKKVTSALANEPINTPQSTWHMEESHSITDDEQRASQSKEIEEGEIPESEDEPTVEPSQGSPSDTVRVSSTLTVGDLGTAAENKVSSSQEVTLHTDCYINMIPISPAPPESPNHESQGDRTSPLPPWPPIESQFSQVVPCSLSLAARMTSKVTPFPYSTLSINVGSASSSARSSPVPQSLAVNMAPGSSPSSASLLPRPQEPTPLLSDNYEPLSDDEDDEGLADSSNTSDEHNI